MTAAELAALPDALAERLQFDIAACMRHGKSSEIKPAILAALREAMQAVRKRDAEICRNAEHERDNGFNGLDAVYNLACEDCAAAIEREPLP